MELCMFEPEIAQNAGTLARLCACLGVGFNIIEPASFIIDDKKFKRAGMDYIEKVDIKLHNSFGDFKKFHQGRIILLDTKAKKKYYDLEYQASDCIMVGKESTGVPDAVFDMCDEQVLIPMQENVRSINVAISAAIGISEALRQTRLF